MNIGTLTGIAFATLFASVVAVAAVISFGGNAVAMGIANVAVLVSAAFVGVAVLVDRRRKP